MLLQLLLLLATQLREVVVGSFTMVRTLIRVGTVEMVVLQARLRVGLVLGLERLVEAAALIPLVGTGKTAEQE
jgi:hypothetical protein